jgi:hypothetical protein
MNHTNVSGRESRPYNEMLGCPVPEHAAKPRTLSTGEQGASGASYPDSGEQCLELTVALT